MTYINTKSHDHQITVKTPYWKLQLADSQGNRKILMVILRGLQDPETGKHLFTFQMIADVFGYRDRRNVNNYWREFKLCEKNIPDYITRKRKVGQEVVQAVQAVLQKNVLSRLPDLCIKTNERLGRSDLTTGNIQAALDQIPCTVIRKVIRSKWESGTFHPKEEVVLSEAMSALQNNDPQKKGCVLKIMSDLKIEARTPDERQENSINERQAAEQLLDIHATPDDIPESVRLKVIAMSLYFWNVPLSRIGLWMGKGKSTIWNWVTLLAVILSPLIKTMISKRIRSSRIYIDEKWIKIRGKWHYWFVALDTDTCLPVMDTLLPNQGKWSCRWFLLKIKLHGINPKSIITDGLVGYIGAIHQVFPAAKHLLCIFHHQQSVSRWVKKYLGDLSTDKQQLIKGKMKRVVQTEDSRTVFRRLESLEKKNDKEKWGIEPWLKAMHEKLPRLLPAIRKNQHPRTTNAIERFFRQFQRFYKTRNGFHSVKSAVDQLAVFSVTYLFTCQAKSGKSPIEIIIPEATRMPLYQILNDPISWLPSVTQAVDLSRCAVDGDKIGEMADSQYKLAG